MKKIEKHNQLYYENPQISDYEYDQLYATLKALEDQYPQFIDPLSPTQKMGKSNQETIIPHKTKMLSLDNCFTQEDVSNFLIKNAKNLNLETLEYIVEEKIDGVAFNAIYFKGKLKYLLKEMGYTLLLSIK